MPAERGGDGRKSRELKEEFKREKPGILAPGFCLPLYLVMRAIIHARIDNPTIKAVEIIQFILLILYKTRNEKDTKNGNGARNIRVIILFKNADSGGYGRIIA